MESISIVLGRESGQDSSAVIVGGVVARAISGLFVGVIISTSDGSPGVGAKVSGPLSAPVKSI